MSIFKESYKSYSARNFLFWFALSAGAIACYILYKQPHIPLLTLFKNMIIYGSLLTIFIQFAKWTFYKSFKMIKRTQRKKRRELRRYKTHTHRRRLNKESSEKTPHSTMR